MVFVLASLFAFSSKIQIVQFIPLSFNLWGNVQLLIYKNSLIFVDFCDTINSLKNTNLLKGENQCATQPYYDCFCLSFLV